MRLTDGLLLAILSIGNAELLITLVNRLHGMALREQVLHRIRQAHFLMLAAFPVWLLSAVLISGLTLPDFVQRQHVVIKAWLLLCVPGVLGLCFSALRAWLRRDDRHQVACSFMLTRPGSEPDPPVGHGPYRWMTRLPGNECFDLEWTTRTLQFDNLPPAWDGLSILHLSDLHLTGTIGRQYFEELARTAMTLDCDVAVFTGDLIDNPDVMDWVQPIFRSIRAPLGAYFVLGNHDWQPLTDRIRTELSESGWQDLSGRMQLLEMAGHQIALCGTERPWMGRHPRTRTLPDNVFRVVLSHTPDNLSWGVREGVDLMLAGHNHGGQIHLPFIGPVYSPSLHGCRYAGGVFCRKSTVLFVSRGASSLQPIRYGARPEASRLILRRTPSPR